MKRYTIKDIRMSEYGQMIKELQDKTGCSYNQLGVALNMPASQISNYVTGRFNPRGHNAEKINLLYNRFMNGYQDDKWVKVLTTAGIVGLLVWMIRNS